MPGPMRSPSRQPGEPIEPEFGSDWLANLSRFHRAEQASPYAAGRFIQPEQDGPMTTVNPEARAYDPELLNYGPDFLHAIRAIMNRQRGL